VTAYDFVPRGTSDTYQTDADGYRYTTGGNRNQVAPLRLPEGAVIVLMLFHNCDPGGAHMQMQLFDFRLDDVALLASVTSDAKADCGYDAAVLSTPYTNASNFGHHLGLSMIQNGPADGTVSFDRVEVFYRLSVSPAPTQAEFGDVPTSHPFFQFIEALYASGITAGCGAGNFCPDEPLTRGQMAVFLAKALGLHWHN
jgi:hypothetical protein